MSGVDARGKTKYRTVVNDLVIRNEGDVTAEGITVTVDPMGGSVHFTEPEPFDLTRGSEAAFQMISLEGSNNVKVRMQWTEEGEAREFTQTARLT